MPIATVTVTIATWICDMCGRHTNHTAGTGAGLAAEHFIDKEGWRLLESGTVVCDRCRNSPDVVYAQLANKGARTQ